MQALFKSLLGSFRDLLPIILVIGFFQVIVLQQPLPNWISITFGLVLVVVGLTLFVYGLDMGLFPIGESMAHSLAHKGSLGWLICVCLLTWLWHHHCRTCAHRGGG
nr:DUF1538 family protein [Salinivibrio socompensis]